MRAGEISATNLSCYCYHIYDEDRYDYHPSPETVHGIFHAYVQSAFGSLPFGHDYESYTDLTSVLNS